MAFRDFLQKFSCGIWEKTTMNKARRSKSYGFLRVSGKAGESRKKGKKKGRQTALRRNLQKGLWSGCEGGGCD